MNTSNRQFDAIDDVVMELSRSKTPAELTFLTSKLFSAARERLRGYLREQHPEWTAAEIQAELLRRIHGAT